jgi:hypothetical protein
VQHYVALLDVLGFSALVAGEGSDRRLRDYLDLLRGVRREPDVRYVAFSDTIVFVSRDGSHESFRAILRTCSETLGSLLKGQIPVRGAISFGSVFISRSAGGAFVAGRAVLDAFEFEKKQDWVGVMIAPSALRENPAMAPQCAVDLALPGEIAQRRDWVRGIRDQLGIAAYLQPCHGIPFHGGHPLDVSSFDGLAVVPSLGTCDPAGLRDAIAECRQVLLRLRSLAPDPEAQAKYDRSYNWLRGPQDTWATVANYWGLLDAPSAT